jgi:hypothetical protein
MQRKHFVFMFIMLTPIHYMPMVMACSGLSLSSTCVREMLT